MRIGKIYKLKNGRLISSDKPKGSKILVIAECDKFIIAEWLNYQCTVECMSNEFNKIFSKI